MNSACFLELFLFIFTIFFQEKIEGCQKLVCTSVSSQCVGTKVSVGSLLVAGLLLFVSELMGCGIAAKLRKNCDSIYQVYSIEAFF